MQGNDILIAVSSTGMLYVVDLASLAALDSKHLGKNITLVRSFDEMPDTIFASVAAPDNQYYLTVMFT